LLKLTVITPTLNQGAFIERSIRSVLDQGYENLEFMIVDGGSTDETVEVIRRYEDRLAWWASEPDEGQTHALSKGIERATGDVIAYMNSDDHYLPGAFDAALTALENSDAKWVSGAALNLDENDRPTDERGGRWEPWLPTEIEHWPRGRHWWFLRHWSPPQPSTFWRRELFERYGGFRRDMHLAFDVEFMERLVLAGEMPLLLRDTALSARVMHAEAKSFDNAKWEPEYKLTRRLLRPQLTLRERALLRIGLMIAAFGPLWERYKYRRLLYREGGIRGAFIHPMTVWLGDLLDYLPERIRPRIRTRDRHRAP
jgi:glycosyltransferase involved in cell wall biosynthesis